jgi:hypothetical protein
MEARRTFDAGAKSSKQIWLVVAAFLAVVALGVAGAYFAKGINFASAPGRGHVVKIVSTQGPDAVERNAQLQRAVGTVSTQGPDAQERNAKLRSAQGAASLTDRNSGNAQSDAVAPRDSRTGPQIAP